MRILISTFSRNVVGGTETYLRSIMPALAARRHEVALFHEIASRADAETIDQRGNLATALCVEQLGADATLEAARQFAPDVVYQHGLLDAELERRMLDLAPSVLFFHSYYGTCVSGA